MTQQNPNNDQQFDDFKGEFLGSLYELFPALTKSQEQVYFGRLKKHSQQYKVIAEHIKDNHKGKSIPSLPVCMEMADIVTRRKDTTAGEAKPGGATYADSYSRAEKMAADYMLEWSQSKTHKQAQAEGWSAPLYRWVKEMATTQAQFVSGCRNVAYNAVNLFTINCDDENERQKWCRREWAAARDSGKVDVCIPTWALDECQRYARVMPSPSENETLNAVGA